MAYLSALKRKISFTMKGSYKETDFHIGGMFAYTENVKEIRSL